MQKWEENTDKTGEKTGFSFPKWISRQFSILLSRPFAYFLITCVAGSYIGYYLHGMTRWIASVGILLLFGVLTIKKSLEPVPRLVSLAGILVFVFFLIFFSIRQDEIRTTPDKEYFSGTARVVSMNAHDEGYKNVLLKLSNGEKIVFLTDNRLEYGSKVSIQGDLERVQQEGNPGDTDLVAYFTRLGVARKLKLEGAVTVEKRSAWIVHLTTSLRDAVKSQFQKFWQKTCDEETSMVLSAMILGDKTALSREKKKEFQNSGLSHLLVVSGAHVSYFTATIAALYGFLDDSTLRKRILLTICLLFFGCVTGWGSSATRSIVTFIAISWLSVESRSVDRISACSLSGLFLICLDPYSVFSHGVLLSFGSTLSIMLFQKRVTRKIRSFISFLPYELVQSLSCFLCAQMGMMPVLLVLGHSLSFMKALLIILSSFPAELICSLGLICSVIGIIFPIPYLGSCLMIPVRGLVDLLTLLSELGASRILHGVSLHNLPAFTLLGVVCGLLLLCFRKGFAQKIVSVMLIEAVLFGALSYAFLPKALATFYFLDVGQGDAALLVMNGKSVLIDGGREGCGHNEINGVMDYLDLYRIDIAIVSHLDTDHIAGIIELWQEERIDQIYAPFWSDSSEMQELQAVYHTLPGQVSLLKKGDCIEMDTICLRIIWPEHALDGGNEDSIVVLAECGQTNVLFTGDIGMETEKAILSALPESIDVLKVAHHGSRYSTGEEFLSNKKIGAAVISVGYNSYGHPSREVLSRLDDRNISCYRTDCGGCVKLSIYETSWEIGYYFG